LLIRELRLRLLGWSGMAFRNRPLFIIYCACQYLEAVIRMSGSVVDEHRSVYKTQVAVSLFPDLRVCTLSASRNQRYGGMSDDGV
jgi:hypothetical protein